MYTRTLITLESTHSDYILISLGTLSDVKNLKDISNSYQTTEAVLGIYVSAYLTSSFPI